MIPMYPTRVLDFKLGLCWPNLTGMGRQKRFIFQWLDELFQLVNQWFNIACIKTFRNIQIRSKNNFLCGWFDQRRSISIWTSWRQMKVKTWIIFIFIWSLNIWEMSENNKKNIVIIGWDLRTSKVWPAQSACPYIHDERRWAGWNKRCIFSIGKGQI